VPSRQCRVTAHDGRRVAPFGDRGITGCQPLPRAFRRVAASFLGCRRQGIHRPPILAERFIAPPNAPPSPTRASPGHPGSYSPRQVTALTSTFIYFASRHRFVFEPHVLQPASLRSHRSGKVCQRASVGRATWGQVAMVSCQSAVSSWKTTTGGFPRRWSRGDSNPGPPPCKGGALPAKLRPPRLVVPGAHPQRGYCRARSGRAWTRTRDLGLIRAAL
jgi:hypothetical protein